MRTTSFAADLILARSEQSVTQDVVDQHLQLSVLGQQLREGVDGGSACHVRGIYYVHAFCQ